MRPPRAAPTEASDDGAAARRLAAALGTALQGADGTSVAADELALGGLLADAAQVGRDALDEAFVDTAYDLLDDLERAYGLPVQPDLLAAARQARLVAKVRAGRAATPAGIARALAPYDGTATVTENTPATVPQTPPDAAVPPTPGGARLVFLWGVRLKAAVWADTALRARIDAVLAQMQPAHTTHVLYTNDPAVGFRADDPNSIVDRDVLGT